MSQKEATVKRRHTIPHYDYECKDCGHELEIFHAMSAEPFTECPRCHQPTLIKLIGAGAAVIIPGTKNPCYDKTKDRLGRGKNKTEKPFWRDGPVDKKVLKNPKKYIEEGKVD